MNHWKIGGVQLQLREDGTFSIYQPDSNRVMPAELAVEVGRTIVGAYGEQVLAELDAMVAELAANPPRQVTVGGGVISTSDGPQLSDTERVASSDSSDAQGSDGLSATELEADRNALETSAQLDVKDLLGQMTAEAHADGTDETVTDFGPARAETPKPQPARDMQGPAPKRRGRPRKTT